MKDGSDDEREEGFDILWNSHKNDVSMLEITRTSKKAYGAFIVLIAPAMVGSSKWKRYLDMGSIGEDLTLSRTVTTADEAYGLLCLENSREKWTEEAAYRTEHNKWRGEKLTKTERDNVKFADAKYSERGDKLNGWDTPGIKLCDEMNRKIIKFRREEVDTTIGGVGAVVNKQKLFDTYVEELLCTNYGDKKKSSPLTAMRKQQKMNEREEHLQHHEYNFEMGELVGVTM